MRATKDKWFHSHAATWGGGGDVVVVDPEESIFPATVISQMRQHKAHNQKFGEGGIGKGYLHKIVRN